jgi:hypothetical protein
MRKLFTILAAILFTASVFAQAPEKISYQAVIRNSSNALVTNHDVGLRISILNGSSDGTVVYTETQTPITNESGLMSTEIGDGPDFITIDWANGPYFLKTETDPTGGTNYTITGTSQLLSVPYALHAKTAESITGTNALIIGQNYQGGIIFWLDASGQHGLIIAGTDQGIFEWNNGTNKYIGTQGDGLYSGAMNTAIIVASQMADDQSGEFAAKVCADYAVQTDEYDYAYGDWYLPSGYELMLLSLNKDLIGGLANTYWSSTEDSNTNALSFSFDLGPKSVAKNTSINVRAIRAF